MQSDYQSVYLTIVHLNQIFQKYVSHASMLCGDSTSVMEPQLEKNDAREDYKNKKENDEGGKTGRKLWKTLDTPLTDVAGDDNLYLAVRQSLHKVNRVSQTSLIALKSSPKRVNRSGVSRESTIGRFSTIKALFEQNVGQVEQGIRFHCGTTMMGRLTTMLGLGEQDLFFDELTSTETVEPDLGLNSDAISN